MASIAIIAVTPGEPAGVGPDISVQLAQQQHDCAIVFVADPAILETRAKALGLPFRYNIWRGREHAETGTYVLPIRAPQPAVPGQLELGNAAYVLETLHAAADGCLQRDFDALVTAPVQKSILSEAGIPFTGHTEFFGERCGVDPVMMLACPGLRVALATTHVPIAEVSRHITRAQLRHVLTVLHEDLQTKFGIARPRISVCGLNPHAGESGYLGREEIDVIRPVIEELNATGMQLRGPVPADTAFVPAQLAHADAVLAMYHDQGLPVIKHHDFAQAVNVTLGLPFVRTSVDHGTALDIAGSGQADPSSLYAAVALARELAQ